MNLWTPEHTPPQVSNEACNSVTQLVYNDGLRQNWGDLTFLFRDKHRPLRDYMSVFGVDEEGEPYSDYRPVLAFRVGGILADLAYQKSGYDENINEGNFALGLLDAEIEGIPEVYVTKLSDDPGLQQLIEGVSAVADLGLGVVDDEGYRGALELGAGCVRHYLKHALQAA